MKINYKKNLSIICLILLIGLISVFYDFNSFAKSSNNDKAKILNKNNAAKITSDTQPENLLKYKDISEYLLVKKSKYKAYYIKNEKIIKQYEIALGQKPVGRKEKDGDLKVPEGIYSVVKKSKGPFDHSQVWFNEYLGTRWIKLNYPNIQDAEIGLKNEIISKEDYNSICKAVKENKCPPQNTALGNGIGIHGWKGDWENDGDRDITWGCVSFHKNDLEEIFDKLSIGSVVIIES